MTQKNPLHSPPAPLGGDGQVSRCSVSFSVRELVFRGEGGGLEGVDGDGGRGRGSGGLGSEVGAVQQAHHLLLALVPRAVLEGGD